MPSIPAPRRGDGPQRSSSQPPAQHTAYAGGATTTTTTASSSAATETRLCATTAAEPSRVTAGARPSAGVSFAATPSGYESVRYSRTASLVRASSSLPPPVAEEACSSSRASSTFGYERKRDVSEKAEISHTTQPEETAVRQRSDTARHRGPMPARKGRAALSRRLKNQTRLVLPAFARRVRAPGAWPHRAARGQRVGSPTAEVVGSRHTP